MKKELIAAGSALTLTALALWMSASREKAPKHTADKHSRSAQVLKRDVHIDRTSQNRAENHGETHGSAEHQRDCSANSHSAEEQLPSRSEDALQNAAIFRQAPIPGSNYSPQHIMKLPSEDLLALIEHSDHKLEVHWATWSLANAGTLTEQEARALRRRLERTDTGNVPLLKTLVWALALKPEFLPMPLIDDFAQNHESADVRRFSLRALSRRPKESLSTITRLALQDSAPEIRREAIALLTLSLSKDQALALATRALGTESDPRLRRSWLSLIGNQGSHTGHALLETVLRSPEEAMETRVHAAQWLALSAENRQALLADPNLPEEIRAELKNS